MHFSFSVVVLLVLVGSSLYIVGLLLAHSHSLDHSQHYLKVAIETVAVINRV